MLIKEGLSQIIYALSVQISINNTLTGIEITFLIIVLVVFKAKYYISMQRHVLVLLVITDFI